MILYNYDTALQKLLNYKLAVKKPYCLTVKVYEITFS